MRLVPIVAAKKTPPKNEPFTQNRKPDFAKPIYIYAVKLGCGPSFPFWKLGIGPNFES